MIVLSDQEFTQLRDYVLANFGIDLSKKRMLIQGRLTATLQSHGFSNFTDYIHMVMQDKSGAEVQKMLNKLTTNLTFFMREKEHFQFLRDVALPEYDQTVGSRELRVWSAGCSSGEEPYTLAMTLLDYYEKHPGKRFVILASDLSQQVLSLAQLGIYPAESLKDLPQGWAAKYFNKLDNDNYQVKESVRRLVTFKIFNLMEPFHFKSPFEIIFCRNVMIYFEKQKKEELIQKFYNWTAPNCYFFISHSENIGRSDTGYRMVKPSIFKKDAR